MSKKKTIEEYKSEIKYITNNEFSVLSSNYINNETNIKFKHNICNNEFYMRPTNFNKRFRCLICHQKSKIINKLNNKDNNSFNYISNQINNNEFKLISINNNKIELLHNKCNRKFIKEKCRFLNNQKCPLCSLKIKTTNEFKQELFNLVNNEYELIDDYINIHTKVKFKHNTCNNEFEMSPHNFKLGHRCPYCKSSKGEIKISNYLNNHNINYIQQYSFNDCKYKRKLLFDFYLEDYNLCIEYDGIQHYKSIDNFGGDKEFKLTQLRDNIKNKYCKDKNILLIRIKYTDYNNIDSILNKYFNFMEEK